MELERLKETFKNYVDKFDTSERAIERKYVHSLRVMDICDMLAKANNCNENDIELANIIGLLHDYGRFPQWTKYKTYSDIESIDHAELAIELLFKNCDITNYTLETEDYDEIYDAIKYHNKYVLPDNLSVHNRNLVDLIRDADKLDIFYIFSTNKDLIMEDNEEISEDIRNDFYNRINIDRRKVKNNSDNILLDLSMVYDLNLDSSYKYLYDNKLIDKIFDTFENKEKYKEYFDYINEFIKEKVGKLC